MVRSVLLFPTETTRASWLGSQFFITTVSTPWLDGKHVRRSCATLIDDTTSRFIQVVFGEVIDGMDLVRKIEGMGSQSGKTQQKISIAESGELKK